MTDFTTIVPPSHSSFPVVARGVVAKAPASFSDPMTVTLVEYSNFHDFDVPAGQWAPKSVLPVTGDQCVVLMDDHGDVWVPLWGPPTDAGGGGGGISLPIAESAVTGLISDLAAKEATANKGAANGYAPLDASSKVPAANLPAAAGVPDASTTVKGASKLSVAPAVAANPIAVGDNDPRNSDARAPTAHTHPESDVTNLVTDLAAKEVKTAKGAANGYAPLDSGSLVPVANLPVATGSVRGVIKTGTGATDAAAGNDARLSDRRQPLTTLETSLATDFTMTSPASTRVLQGSFVADFTEVEVTVHVNGYDIDSRVAYAGFVFFYGTVAQPVWNDNQAADRAGVTRVNLGEIAGQPGSFTRRIVLSGLTVGATYNWALASGIVGFSTTVNLPEACSFVTVSKSGAPAGALLDDFNDRLIVVSSATKMYLIRSNHTTKIKDELVGNGIPFVTGHGTGLGAISPDGNRILATNTSLGSASLYDVYDPPQPVLLATFALGLTNPFAAVWAPDGSACYVADFGQTPGHVKKITGLTGANYAPVVSATVATLGTVGSSPAHLRITPDGTKVLVGDGTTEFYVVNTSTMAVTKVTVPGATSAAGIDAISNTQAIVSYGTNTFAILDLNALTFSATFTDPGLNGQLYAFKDGLTSLAMRQAAGGDAIGHVNHPVNSGNTNLNMYTHWSTSGTPKDHVIDDQGNIMVVNNTPNNLAIWYGSQFLIRPTGTGTSLAERAIVQVRGGH